MGEKKKTRITWKPIHDPRNSRTFQREKLDVLEGYAPDVKACGCCGHPFVDGYCCTTCGAPDPDDKRYCSNCNRQIFGKDYKNDEGEMLCYFCRPGYVPKNGKKKKEAREQECCCVVDQDCEFPANVEDSLEEPPTRLPRCYACGQPVCKTCSSIRTYYAYGRRRLCNTCQHEYDGGESLHVLKRIWQGAGYKNTTFQELRDKGHGNKEEEPKKSRCVIASGGVPKGKVVNKR